MPSRFRGPRSAVVAVALVAVVAASPLDALVQDAVFRHVVSHEVRLLANGFTLLGTSWAAAGLLGAVAAAGARAGDAALARAALGGLAGLAVGGLATQVLKVTTCRARPRLTQGWGVGPLPDPAEVAGAHGFFHWPCLASARHQGFPSGHAATAFTVAAVLAGAAPAGRRGWLLAAAGVAASRVVLNAHFLSDVLGGALVGWWAADAGRHVVERVAARRRSGAAPRLDRVA
jgi:membrane-associated phospholipid phosphatase